MRWPLPSISTCQPQESLWSISSKFGWNFNSALCAFFGFLIYVVNHIALIDLCFNQYTASLKASYFARKFGLVNEFHIAISASAKKPSLGSEGRYYNVFDWNLFVGIRSCSTFFSCFFDGFIFLSRRLVKSH